MMNQPVNSNRRSFLTNVPIQCLAAVGAVESLLAGAVRAADKKPAWIDDATAKEWLVSWEKNILGDMRHRYCDTETGEEIGWVVSPFLNGFYYGYQTTRDIKWVEFLVDWTESVIKRGVREPDGYLGWPKGDGGGGDSKEYTADSLLGEALFFMPVVLMAAEILKTPSLEAKWGSKAREYIELANKTFEKWDSRDCWRDVKEGGCWVVSGFGVDLHSPGQWSASYAQRKTDGFSNPDNKQNEITRWLMVMHDVTKKPIYRERSEKWFQLMRSRMHTRDNDKYFVWNYWEPAGPWDYKPGGAPRHWVGVHPNGGYYEIDVTAIVEAFEHGLVFKREDIDRLIATNRDFMWNHQIEGAKFQRIDGGETDPRWKNSPGLLWTSLMSYDETLRKIFVANHKPASWGGLGSTPWFLAKSGAKV